LLIHMATTRSSARPAAKSAAKRAAKRAAPPTAKGAAPRKAASRKTAPAPRAAAAPAKAAKPVKPPKAPKAIKAPKLRTKPVRDSFTMPEADFALIATLKARTLSAKRVTKKSELLRAGLHALAAMDTATLVATLGALEPVKIGRPKSGR
jgi:hypothetical protein